MNDSAYDAIVVGSGAGGAAAAYQLVAAGMHVLLLEKGNSLPRDGTTLDVERVVSDGRFLSREPWIDGSGNRITPEEHFNTGGKTKWYGAALFRFDEREFQADPAHGCRGWPLSATELSRYYSQAEQLIGVRTFGCEPDLARIVQRLTVNSPRWRFAPMPMALAPDIASHPVEAAHFDGFASVRGLKGEAESAFLSRVLDNHRLTLLEGAEVEGLIGASGAPASIVGVRLRDGTIHRAPRVLLAAGALHSPRLLSRYVRESGLDTSLRAAATVGRNLKLHLLTAMVALSPGIKRDLIRKTTVLFHDEFPHSSVQPLGFDGELIGTLMPKILPDAIRRALGARAYGFFLQTEDGSASDNRILDLDPPVMDYAAERLPQAAREHRQFTHAFQRALLRAGLVSFVQRIGLNGTAHACGSLVCGDSPTDSVVNPNGRVHGMSGLYVVDGSVLPRSSRVNPALTIYAWSLRVGDLLGREFSAQRAARGLRVTEHANAI